MSNDEDNIATSVYNFEFFEKKAIEYEIAIDEGRYDDIVDCDDKDLKEKINVVDRNEFLNAIKNIFKKLDIEPVNSNNPEKINLSSSISPKSENRFWTLIFFAKKNRAILLNQHSDNVTIKFDWIVDFLLQKMGNYVTKPFEYLLLTLELSAITVGEQSLGFSEKARGILTHSLNNTSNFSVKKRSLYESLIYYNQGIAKAHMYKHQDVVEEYNKAINQFKDNDDIDKRWCNYVYYPSLLQKADLLSKMQFSFNALNTLNEIRDCNNHCKPSAFIKARRDILKAFCYFDISDLDKFDKHFETVNNLKDKNGKYFKKPLVNISDILNSNAPQNPSINKYLPSLLGSHYNSLVIGRAKEALQEKINIFFKSNELKDKLLPEFSSFKIFNFLEEYLKQSEDNRFDRLTLKETILDYMEILKPLIKIELNKRKYFKKEGPIIKTLNHLKELLDGPLNKRSFAKEEIDPDKKPSMQPRSINKAYSILGSINDEILKMWFNLSGNKIALPRYLQSFFNFEMQFLVGIMNKQTLFFKRKYDVTKLKIRKQLLEKISGLQNTDNLKDELVCICTSFGDNRYDIKLAQERTTCLDYSTKAIKADLDDKVTNIINSDHTILRFSDYDKILEHESKSLSKYIKDRSVQPVICNNIENNFDYSINYVGLRRWNSYTPALSFSVGGGHFIFLADKKGKVLSGIVVDPGFDFIRNFFRQGFTLTDIDLILLTHGHPDHIRDFPAIIELLFEHKKRYGKEVKESKIYAIMSLGCYQRLQDHIAKEPFKLLFYDTVIVDINENQNNIVNFSCNADKDMPLKLQIEDNTATKGVKLEVQYFIAFHDDHSESDSYGFKLAFNKNNDGQEPISIGFTGDSKWFPQYAKKFKDCNIICSHIGSIVETEKNRKLKDYTHVGKAERLIRTKNHPYLFGEILFMQDWKESLTKKSLVLISEFGEEMKGNIRCDLTKRINYALNEKNGCWENLSCIEENSEKPRNSCSDSDECKRKIGQFQTIPVDVGLRVSTPLINKPSQDDAQIYCIVCGDFREINNIDYEVFGHEEAIFYICKTCSRSKSVDVRHTIYRKYLESGRELKKE